jgi:hypothetical protein
MSGPESPAEVGHIREPPEVGDIAAPAKFRVLLRSVNGELSGAPAGN